MSFCAVMHEHFVVSIRGRTKKAQKKMIGVFGKFFFSCESRFTTARIEEVRAIKRAFEAPIKTRYLSFDQLTKCGAEKVKK